LTAKTPRVSSAALEVAPIAQLDRALVYGTSCRKFESSWARKSAEDLVRSDEEWMRAALDEADAASKLGEVPVGCVLVGKEGEELSRAHNLRESRKDPIAHAETIAIRAAAERIQSWRLEGATLFVTLEPCPMCAGALLQARVSRVVFGCDDPKAGALVTLYTLGADSRLNHRFEVTGGILASECASRLSAFFAQLRVRGKG
jgi:tRNA(adenine34) deaminase